MYIDKTTIHQGIWYEDKNGNFIPYDSDSDFNLDPPENAHTRHVCFPLEINERVEFLKDDEGNSVEKPSSITWSVHIGGGNSPVILAMANSGEYTLTEALAVYAEACERCSNVLAYNYLNGEDGYAEGSEEWLKCNTECRFCRNR